MAVGYPQMDKILKYLLNPPALLPYLWMTTQCHIGSSFLSFLHSPFYSLYCNHFLLTVSLTIFLPHHLQDKVQTSADPSELDSSIRSSRKLSLASLGKEWATSSFASAVFCIKSVSHFMGFIYLPYSPRLESPWGQSLCLSCISTTSAQHSTGCTRWVWPVFHSFIHSLLPSYQLHLGLLPPCPSTCSHPHYWTFPSLLPLARIVLYSLFHSSFYLCSIVCNLSLWYIKSLREWSCHLVLFMLTLAHGGLFPCAVCNLGLWACVW